MIGSPHDHFTLQGILELQTAYYTLARDPVLIGRQDFFDSLADQTESEKWSETRRLIVKLSTSGIIFHDDEGESSHLPLSPAWWNETTEDD